MPCRTARAAALAWLLPLAAAAAQPTEPACALRLPQPAHEVGAGTLRWFGMSIYHATLWSGPDGIDSAATEARPLALRLRYARFLRGADIARRSAQLMKGEADPARLQQWQRRMRELFPDVHAGDTLCGVYLAGAPGGPTTLFMAGDRLLGHIDGADFARAFFGIWLSAGTTEARLRQQLLGLDHGGN